MADTFTPEARALFARPVLAHVATLGPDGSPQVTPVWVDLDGDEIVINTALGRAKARNLAADPRVAVSIVDPTNDYNVVAVRGTVTTFTTQGADEVIDHLAKKYLGVDTYPNRRADETRVTAKIHPDRIIMQPGRA
jgi:PPOX class probable F420-dependent enzyme